jgi:hypothetical protein
MGRGRRDGDAAGQVSSVKKAGGASLRYAIGALSNKTPHPFQSLGDTRRAGFSLGDPFGVFPLNCYDILLGPSLLPRS